MSIQTITSEQLDDLVHDVVMNDAIVELNKEPDEDLQDSILVEFESKVSDINNQGSNSQLAFLKSKGLSESDIIKRCE